MAVTGKPAVQFGNSDPIAQGTKRIWVAEFGERQELVYKGNSETLGALYDTLVLQARFDAQYEQIEFDPANGVGGLRVSYKSITVDPDPVYEMFCNEMQTPIENHTYFSGSDSPLSDSEINAVLAAYQRGEGAGGSWSAKQTTLFSFLVRGTHEAIVFQYVLRQTRYDVRTSSMRASWTNVGQVDSPPDVSAANVLIGAIPTCEWLKRAPTVRNRADRLWSIEQEWWGNPTANGGGWSTILYGGTRTP